MTENIKVVRTACPAHCGIDCCGINAHVKDGRVVKLEPAEFPNKIDKRICLRGLSTLGVTYHPDRLKYPLKRVGKRGEDKFERISWEKAYELIVANFKEISEKYGWKSIGWVLGGPGAGTTKFGAYLRLASLTRSTRVSAWGYGDAGLPCGSRVIFGSQFPYIYLFGKFWQRKFPELLIIWGTNPAESMPLQTMRKVMDAKEQGTQIVVIDPRFTVTASKADQFIGLKPATDSALTLGMMNEIINNGLYSEEFIRNHTNGAYLVKTDNGKFLKGTDIGTKKAKAYVIWLEKNEEAKVVRRSTIKSASVLGTYQVNGIECKTAFQMLKELAGDYTLEKTSKITGLKPELIKKLALRIGQTKNVIFYTYMGFTRTYHGDLSLRGMATLASITGHVSTSFSSGFLPPVLNWKPFLKAIPNQPSYHRLGILNLYEAVISGQPYPIKAVWFAFINFINQCVNSNKLAKEFFPKLDFIVQTELFMTPNAKYADIILPVCSFLEFSDFLPHPYPYVQLQQKVIEPLYESKSDVDIVAGLAERLGYGDYFRGGENALIDLILDNATLEGVSRANLIDKAIQLKPIPKGGKFPLNFSTPSGKIEIYADWLAEDGQALPVYLPPIEAPINKLNEKFPLTFVQGHCRYRTHSSMANVKNLLQLNPEPLVEINPKDASMRNINNSDYVTVYNDRARTILKARVSEVVPPGVIDIRQGWWIDQFKSGSVNHLTHDIKNPIQDKIYEPNMHMNDVAVQITKEGGGESK